MRGWVWVLIFGLSGIALGLYYGWMINPVKFLDTTPASLRADYRTDYVLMVAEAYHARQDGDLAQRQLAVLGGISPAAVCTDALRMAQGAAYSQSDLALIQELTRAMQTVSPVALPTAGLP
jgi:hypothetical protein